MIPKGKKTPKNEQNNGNNPNFKTDNQGKPGKKTNTMENRNNTKKRAIHVFYLR